MDAETLKRHVVNVSKIEKPDVHTLLSLLRQASSELIDLTQQRDALEELAEEAIEAYCDTEYNEEHGDELRERLSKIREGK